MTIDELAFLNAKPKITMKYLKAALRSAMPFEEPLLSDMKVKVVNDLNNKTLVKKASSGGREFLVKELVKYRIWAHNAGKLDLARPVPESLGEAKRLLIETACDDVFVNNSIAVNFSSSVNSKYVTAVTPDPVPATWTKESVMTGSSSITDLIGCGSLFYCFKLRALLVSLL